jgi:hypothetical protein
VTLENPMEKKDPRQKAETLILSDTQTRDLIMDLYLPEAKHYPEKAEEKVLVDKARVWIEGNGAVDNRFRQHRDNWKILQEHFKKELHY